MAAPRYKVLAITVTVVFGVASAVGCGDDTSPRSSGSSTFPGFPDQVTFASQHFRFHAHADDRSACTEAVVQLEAHLAALRSFLGFTWPPKRVVDYWLFSSGADFSNYMPCGQGVPICTIGSSVFTYAMPDEHELVHAYLAAVGLPPHFMIEGMAVVLSSDFGPWSTYGDQQQQRLQLGAHDWHDLAAWREVNRGDLGEYYQLSAYVVRLMIDRFGLPAVIAYYGSAPYSRDPDAVDAYFRASFGMSLEAAIVDALAVEYPDGPCLRPYACSALPFALDDAGVDVAAGCGAGFIDRRFEVPAHMAVLVQGGGDAGTFYGPAVRSCQGQPSPRDDTGMRKLDWLAPGTYSMRLTPQGGPFNYQILSGDNRWVSRDCTVAETTPLVMDQRDGMLAVPRTGDTYYIGLSSDGPRRRDFQWRLRSPPPEGTRFCRSCADPPEACLTFQGMGAGITWEGRYVLTVPTDAALGAFVSIAHSGPAAQ